MDGGASGASELHLLIERLSSLFRSQLREQATEHGLKLVQLEALVYLSVANRYSDTAGALTEYLGVTKGTTSQTLLALERRGLVRKLADPDDGRILHCVLTPAGQAIVEAAHPAPALTRLPDAEQAEALAAAIRLLRALQAGRGFKTFGQCRTCAHLRREGPALRCGVTGQALTQGDASRICREHEAPAR